MELTLKQLCLIVGAAIAAGAIVYWHGAGNPTTPLPPLPANSVAQQPRGPRPGGFRGWNFGPPPPADLLTDVPDIETQREADLATAGASASTVTLSTDFDCGIAPNEKQISDTEFSLDYQHKDDDGGPNGVYWFMFRLKGVAGKAVRINFKGIPLDKWHTLNPVYQYTDGAEPAIAQPLLPDDYNLKDAKLIDGHNGTRMPDTSADPGGWHFMPEVWATGGSTLCCIQKFDQDEVTVADALRLLLAMKLRLMEQAKKVKTTTRPRRIWPRR